MTKSMQTKDGLTYPLTVRSHLPEYEVITKDSYIKDLKSRISIHNYEIKALFQQIKDAFNWTKEAYKNLRSDQNN